MTRRNFITIVGAAAAWPLTARAQQGQRTHVLGVLMAGLESAPDNQKRLAAFRQELTDLGWHEGGNIRVEYRWSAGKEELIRKYAEELVALRPDVILANGTPLVGEFKRINSTIPVVFALAMDPVGLGNVQSLSHPGGPMTGFTYIDPEIIGKWMELLKAMAPGITGAAVMFNPATVPSYDNWLRDIAAKPSSGAIAITALHASTVADMEAGIKTLQSEGKGLIIGPDPFNQVVLKEAAQRALEKSRADRVGLSPVRRRGRAHGIRPRYRRYLPPLRGLRRSGAQRRKAGGSASATANQVRIRRQPQDGQGTRYHRAGESSGARG